MLARRNQGWIVNTTVWLFWIQLSFGIEATTMLKNYWKRVNKEKRLENKDSLNRQMQRQFYYANVPIYNANYGKINESSVGSSTETTDSSQHNKHPSTYFERQVIGRRERKALTAAANRSSRRSKLKWTKDQFSKYFKGKVDVEPHRYYQDNSSTDYKFVSKLYGPGGSLYHGKNEFISTITPSIQRKRSNSIPRRVQLIKQKLANQKKDKRMPVGDRKNKQRPNNQPYLSAKRASKRAKRAISAKNPEAAPIGKTEAVPEHPKDEIITRSLDNQKTNSYGSKETGQNKLNLKHMPCNDGSSAKTKPTLLITFFSYLIIYCVY